MVPRIKVNYKLYNLNYHIVTLSNFEQDGSIRFLKKINIELLEFFYNQVKLINKNSLGNKEWNSIDVNIWTGSTMGTYLNGEYLNGLTLT